MESFDKKPMNCERVEELVFDVDREGALDSAEKEAALAHLANCPRCAALQESWQAAREELRQLGDETSLARAPERVEMRLRQEFRKRHQGVLTRRSAMVAAWALAAAAVFVGAVSLRNWQQTRHTKGAGGTMTASDTSRPGSTSVTSQQSGDEIPTDSSSADDAEFTPLPGTTLDDSEEGAVLRVRMQRSSLVALGLPVNEQRASDWIQVDLLVGNDGLPQGVRLAAEEN